MKSQTGLYRPFSSRKWRKNPSSLALKAGIRWSSKPTTIAHERCHGRTSLNTEFSDSLLDRLSLSVLPVPICPSAICWRHYGEQSGAVEVVLEANPGLADTGPVLPAGIIIELPELPPAVQELPTVRLWD